MLPKIKRFVRNNKKQVKIGLLVLLVIVASQFSSSIKILKYSDMVGSILIGILTLIMGIKLLIQSISLLIGEAEQDTQKNNMVKDIIMNRKQSTT